MAHFLNLKWILVGHTPVPCEDVERWAIWFEDINNRRVAEDQIGDVWVSTVFLGLDHSHGVGPPVLFETMAFRGREIIAQDRYASYEEAEMGHTEMLQRVVEDAAKDVRE